MERKRRNVMDAWKKKGGVKKRRFEDIYHLNNLNKKSRSGLIYLKEKIFFFFVQK
jgi:hypothetical protein